MAKKTTSSQSLIAAAQRLYSTKYAEAQKDITPILKGVQGAAMQIRPHPGCGFVHATLMSQGWWAEGIMNRVGREFTDAKELHIFCP